MGTKQRIPLCQLDQQMGSTPYHRGVSVTHQRFPHLDNLIGAAASGDNEECARVAEETVDTQIQGQDAEQGRSSAESVKVPNMARPWYRAQLKTRIKEGPVDEAGEARERCVRTRKRYLPLC